MPPHRWCHPLASVAVQPGNHSRPPPAPVTAERCLQRLPIYQDSATAVSPSSPREARRNPDHSDHLSGLNSRRPFPGPHEWQLGTPRCGRLSPASLNKHVFFPLHDPLVHSLLEKDLSVAHAPGEEGGVGGRAGRTRRSQSVTCWGRLREDQSSSHRPPGPGGRDPGTLPTKVMQAAPVLSPVRCAVCPQSQGHRAAGWAVRGVTPCVNLK